MIPWEEVAHLNLKLFWSQCQVKIFAKKQNTKAYYSERIVGTVIMASLYMLRRRQWHPTPVLLPGKSHGWRSLVGFSPWGPWAWTWVGPWVGHELSLSWTWLSDLTFTFHFHSLEREMATHSNVLAWRIPGMGESGGLPSVGSHRVGHDWRNLAAAAAVHACHKKYFTWFISLNHCSSTEGAKWVGISLYW